MEWKQLLSPTRVRDLFGGEASQRPRRDVRNEFDRDYGRCAFSTPVRRLQDKAQVFPMEEHDSIRTRLTHSVEVSNVSRSLGQPVMEWLVSERGFQIEEVAPIPVIAATCGILHDIGNPPFGHSGEKAMAEWFSRNMSGTVGGTTQCERDFAEWDGNAQTIRLVAKLQVLSDQFGLNLSSPASPAEMPSGARLRSPHSAAVSAT
jgi:dGTPase